MIAQLNPPLWLFVPELDQAGLAHAMCIPSLEDSVYWIIFLDKGGIVTLPSERVRAHKNFSLGRLARDIAELIKKS
jgi:hypothetical protein